MRKIGLSVLFSCMYKMKVILLCLEYSLMLLTDLNDIAANVFCLFCLFGYFHCNLTLSEEESSYTKS